MGYQYRTFDQALADIIRIDAHITRYELEQRLAKPEFVHFDKIFEMRRHRREIINDFNL